MHLQHLHTADEHINQAGGELAFAKAMGFSDWTHFEESEHGVVRGYRVVWSRADDAPLRIPADADPDDRYVLVTGERPTYMVHGWSTAREAQRLFGPPRLGLGPEERP